MILGVVLNNGLPVPYCGQVVLMLRNTHMEPDVACQYVEDFADKIAEKKVFPNSGIPLHYRGLFTGFYSVNFKAYKAFYRVIEDYIEVLRIIPAKRDYMKVLFGELEQD